MLAAELVQQPPYLQQQKDMQLQSITRGGTALEVAQSIIWLVSDEASYVTTSILDVAGGR